MTCLVLPNQTAHADDYVNGVSMDFWKIYDQHYNRVRKFILAYVKDEWVADDLIQETFIKVWTSLGEFRENSSLYTWIYRIAANTCNDYLRKKSRHPILSLEGDGTESDDAPLLHIKDERPLPDEQLENLESADRVRLLLLELPDTMRLEGKELVLHVNPLF